MRAWRARADKPLTAAGHEVHFSRVVFAVPLSRSLVVLQPDQWGCSPLHDPQSEQ